MSFMRLKNLIHNSPILKEANNPKIKETKNNVQLYIHSRVMTTAPCSLYKMHVLTKDSLTWLLKMDCTTRSLRSPFLLHDNHRKV